jgi:hypothetical protein
LSARWSVQHCCAALIHHRNDIPIELRVARFGVAFPKE